MGRQCRTDDDAGCASRTQLNEGNSAITPAMSVNLMRLTVPGRTTWIVRKREQTEWAKCGIELEEFGSGKGAALLPLPPLRTGHDSFLSSGSSSYSKERSSRFQILEILSNPQSKTKNQLLTQVPAEDQATFH